MAIAVGTALSARRAVAEGRQPRRLLVLALAVGGGILAQAVIGGVSVLTLLNPWVVGLHLVVSVALVIACVEMVHATFRIRQIPTSSRLRVLIRVIFWLGLVIVGLGIVVTGAGPNAGDGGAARNGLSLEWTAKIHAWAVWAETALTALGIWWTRSSRRLRWLFLAVAACEVYQGLIGYVQYFTHLPAEMVFLHMIGTTLFVAGLAHLHRAGAGSESSLTGIS